MKTPRLFHFTCDHSYPKLGSRGLLVPQEKPTLFGVELPHLRVVWLTSGGYETTGMDKSDMAICDRGKYRYIVTDTSTCVPWFDSPQRAEMGDEAEMIEAVGDPSAWWVSPGPVPVRLG